jgi:hypothetical protein
MFIRIRHCFLLGLHRNFFLIQLYINHYSLDFSNKVDDSSIYFYVLQIFFLKITFIFLFQINIFMVFLYYFDALISKIIFKK